MADAQVLAQYFKLADAASELEDAHSASDDKFWDHFVPCLACNPSQAHQFPEFPPKMRLNCSIGTALQFDYARTERRRNEAETALGEHQFSVEKDMPWVDLFAYAVGALKGEWIAIEIPDNAKKLSEDARNVFAGLDHKAVPAQVSCSILSVAEKSFILIIRAVEVRAAHERMRPKISIPEIKKNAVPSSHVNWDILPAGSRDSADARAKLASELSPDAAGDPEIAKIVFDRIEFFESLQDPKPLRFIKGLNSFSSYFGVQFSSELVAFENPTEGNAIYIVFGRWEEISKFSKSDLLAMTEEDRTFVRVIHVGDWKQRFRDHLARLATDSKDG